MLRLVLHINLWNLFLNNICGEILDLRYIKKKFALQPITPVVHTPPVESVKKISYLEIQQRFFGAQEPIMYVKIGFTYQPVKTNCRPHLRSYLKHKIYSRFIVHSNL